MAAAGPIKPLLNGNFESGPDGSWTEYSSRGWDLILHSSYFEYVTPHGGQWAVWLGGDDDETAHISQPVTITAAQPYLHFWVWIESEDVCGYDIFHIKINGTEVAYADLCYEHNTHGWAPIVWDLSAYSGQTVTLTFEVTTDFSLISSLFLDDVSLSFSNTADAPEENQLTSPFGRSLPIQKKRE